MIVSNYNGRYQLFTQHDHSILSGQFVPYWSDKLFLGFDRMKDLQLAVREHDRAWISLDEKPIWNDEKNMPHSFMDYPMEPKLDAYKQGVDEVERLSPYAGYLNSLHFLSFFKQKSTDSHISRFISREIDRQNRLETELNLSSYKEEVDFHFNFLQFCDDLSLYICLNEPNTSKENETFMFKEGFRQRFNGLDQRMNAHWVDDEVVIVRPFPFMAPFKVSIPFKEITEQAVEEKGVEQAYLDSKNQVRQVLITY